MSNSPRERYLKKRFYHNRNAIARVADAVFFLLIVFFAALLFFQGRVFHSAIRLLLAGIVSASAGVFLRIITGLRYEIFCNKEIKRLTESLFLNRLCFLSDAKLKRLITATSPGSNIRILHRAEPADADAVLSAFVGSTPIALLSTAGFTDSARAFASRQENAIQLIEPKTLLPEAERAKLLPDAAELDAEMERRCRLERQTRQKAVRLAFSGAFPGKYYLCAASLILLSFLTRYAMYYRILAVFTMCVAVLGTFLSRFDRPHPGV